MGGCSRLQSPEFFCLLSKISHTSRNKKKKQYRKFRRGEAAELLLSSFFEFNATKVILFFHLCYFFLYEARHSEASSSEPSRALLE